MGRLRGPRLGLPARRRRACWPRCARSGWPPPSSGRSASLPTTRRRGPQQLGRLRPERGRRLPPGAAARPRPRPAARGRRVHRRLPGRRRRRRRARGLHRRRGVRRPPGPRRRRAGQTLLANLDRITDHAAARGVVAALHPHVGTMVETGEETERVLAGSTVGLCVDTGHLAGRRRRPGGARPRPTPDRVVARAPQGRRRRPGRAGASRASSRFGDAVRAGLPCRSARATSTSRRWSGTLEAAGYQGWYVLEQDVMLDGEPDGDGPVADVRPMPRLPAGGGSMTRDGEHGHRLRGAHDGTRRRRHLPASRSASASRTSRPSASTSAAAPPTSRSPPPGTAAARRSSPAPATTRSAGSSTRPCAASASTTGS